MGDDDAKWAWAGRALFAETVTDFVNGNYKEITESQKQALIQSEKKKQEGSYEFERYVDELNDKDLYTVCDYWTNTAGANGIYRNPTRTLYRKTKEGSDKLGMLVFYTREEWYKYRLPELDLGLGVDGDDLLPEPTPSDAIPECPSPFSAASLADSGTTTILNLRDALVNFPNYLSRYLRV